MAVFSSPIRHLLNGTFTTSEPAKISAPDIGNFLIAPIDAKKTKIVATIGPATESEEKIAELVRAGMNVARFNTKHNEPAWHREIIQRVRKVEKQMHVPIGILIDLQGPEIRITLNQDQFAVKKKNNITFTSADFSRNNQDVLVPVNVIHSLNVGNRVIMDDGVCNFIITAKSEDHLTAECLDDCIVKNHKTMNTPNVVMEMPALLPKDESYLEELRQEHIEYVALSFVRTREDILHLQNVLAQKNLAADVIAKIENRKAVENLESIIQVSDGVMVARGDLAVEVDYEELIYWQKKIISLCQKHARPVITATQMLASMTENPMPTRAEISDVANAVYDGTDAVMLSEETTTGKFPIKAVEVQAKISRFYEQYTTKYLPLEKTGVAAEPAIHVFIDALKKQPKAVEKVVVITDQLKFVRQLSSLHVRASLLVVTTSHQLCQRLTLSYGIEPIFIPDFNLKEKSIDELIATLKATQKLSLGEIVLFLYNLTQFEGNTSNQIITREIV